LSFALWERRFGKDPAILGRKIVLNGAPVEIIGVMAPEYRFPTRSFELWTPLFVPQEAIQGRYGDFNAVGRLRPGATIEQAQTEISAIMDRDPTAVANGFRLGLFAEPFLDAAVGPVKDVLWTLLEAVGALLLIGCLSLGGLLVARAGARFRELSVRAALGADVGRLRRQMLAETLPLSAAGITGGVALAWALVQGLRSWLPATMPRTETIALHAPVLAFSAVISVAVVLLAAILPALLVGRTPLAETMRASSRSVTGASGLRQWLVAAQIAVTLAILFGGGLLARSLAAQLAVRPGFETDGVLTLHLAVTRAKYPKDEQISIYLDRIAARVKTIPGVIEAGLVNRLPLSGTGQVNPVEFEGRPELGVVSTSSRSATPGYFGAMRSPVVRGRAFAESDKTGGPSVGVIDELLARRVFGGSDPVGKRFRFSPPNFKGPWVEIVGVVGHIRNEGPQEDTRPQVYWPESQRAQDRAALVVRTSREPNSLTSAVIEQIRQENPEQAVYDVRTLDEWMDRVMQTRTLLTGLVGAFAGAALLLACLGLYGVVAYNTNLRMREFGVRMALGAATLSIQGLVLRQAGRVVIAGAVIGLLVAWPVGLAVRGLLFEVPAADLWSLAGATLLLLMVALGAALGPAVRASKANPATVLRAD
jgi:predicted permease